MKIYNKESDVNPDRWTTLENKGILQSFADSLIRPKCQLTDEMRRWIEQNIVQMIENSAIDINDSGTVLPTQEFFPEVFAGDEDSAQNTLNTVCRFLKIPVENVSLGIYDDGASASRATGILGQRKMNYAAGIYEGKQDNNFFYFLLSDNR
jgi:hypothetical protein